MARPEVPGGGSEPDQTQRAAADASTGPEDATYVRQTPSTPDAGAAPWTEPARGMEVGRYVILKPVGHGGMGVVYAAYDPDLDRKVALKILRPSRTESDAQARARLVREAQAMARVSHPNVCSVFDVGMHADQVFVAMEFVEGSTLQDWLKQSHPWREVLEVMLKAGRGLLAAHEAGLIHRDFKPANVLLDEKGRPRVTDFGVARFAASGPGAAEALGNGLVSGPPMLTGAGMVVGTPLYMPPEQYLGRMPDARSDQFSFCVVLYQALYGKHPFDLAMMPEVARDMLTGHGKLDEIIDEPPRDSNVPRWLRQAVLRGLALDPKDRFADMKALLEMLSQEPRRARNRRALLASGAALLAFAAGTGVLWRQSQVCDGADDLMAEVWNADVRRGVETSFAATGKPFAAQVARTVTQALDAYARGWIRQSTDACVATRVRGLQTEELLSRQVVCLERRRKDLRALTQLLASADDKLVEKAVDAASALPALRECQDLEGLSNLMDLPADPARRAEIERLQTRLSEAKVLLDAGRYQQGLELARQVEPQAAATGHRPLAAEARFHLGWLSHQAGETEPGAKWLEEAFRDAEAGRADRLKVAILNKLLFAQGRLQRWELAELWGRVARATLTRIGEDALLTGDVMMNLANVELMRSRTTEARGYLDQAQALLPPEHPKRAKVLFMLATAALETNEEARAVELMGEALRRTEALQGKEHPDTARIHLLLGEALRRMGDHVGANEHAQAALERLRTTLGSKHPEVIVATETVGMGLLELKRYDEALETFRDALALAREDVGEDDPGLQFSYDGIGQALVGLGRFAEAVPPLEKAMSFKSKLETSDQLRTLGESGFGLARALWGLGQRDRARAEASRAREVFARTQHAKKLAELDAWLGSLRAGTATRPAP